MNRPQQPQDRREMFWTSVRYLALGGIGLLSAGLIAPGSGPPGRGRCGQPVSCGDCRAIARCTLPAARAARRSNSR